MNFKNSKDLYDIWNMSDDEFYDYMIDEYKRQPPDKEIIKNSGKTIESIIKEINLYQDMLVFLAYKYDIPLKNKAAFILKIYEQKNNIKEIMPLLSCFIIKPDYMLKLKDKRVSIKKEGIMAEYLLLKEEVDNFEKSISEIHSNAQKYKSVLKSIKNNDSKNVDMFSENKRILTKLYKQYLQVKTKNKEENLIEYENNCISENIEQIHNFAIETPEKRKIYPLIVYQIFIRYRLKILKKMELLNCRNIMNYKRYTIYKNNDKNFNTYSRYIELFLELVDNFSDICDVPLCMYGFEKTSNLVEWLFKNTLYRDIFHHCIYSLVESTYSSIFFEESIFLHENDLYIKDFFGFKVQDEGSNDKKESYLSELVEEYISKDDIVTYLSKCALGRRQGAKFIKTFAYKFLKLNNCKLENAEDEGYVFLTFEKEFQLKADDFIKQKIIEILE